MTKKWVVLVVRVPSEPARHRVAIWRELRKAGAIVLGPAVWALPDVPASRPVLDRVGERTRQAEGQLLRLSGTGFDDVDDRQLDALYERARNEEWTEFLAECRHYLAELEKEHAKQKYTLAELEEEEQSLERLRRWYRDIRARDLLGTRAVDEADKSLKQCHASFDAYADAVYAAVGQAGGL